MFQLRRFLKHKGPHHSPTSVVGCVALLIFSREESFRVLQTFELDPSLLDILYIFCKKYEGLLYFLYGGVTGHLPHLSVTSNSTRLFSTLSLLLLLLLLPLLLSLPLPLLLLLLCLSYIFCSLQSVFPPQDFLRRTGPRSTLWLLSQIRTSCSCLAKGKTISPCRPLFLSFVRQFLVLATITAAHEPRSSR